MRWTQRRLADELGVDIKSVDNWENNRTRPRSSLGALEEVLGVDLTGEPEPGPLADLEPFDEWESEVAGRLSIPEEDRRWLITASRDARDAGRSRRQRRAAEEAGWDRSSPGSAAG